MKGKKGLLYSLGLALFALLILMSALLIGKQGNSAESYFIDLVVTQQAQEIQTSTSEAFSEVYLREGGITITLRNTSLNIIENLSHDYTSLEQIFTNLESNIENNFEVIQINQTEFQRTNGFFLQPLNISYTHKNEQSIQIDKNPYIKGYTLNLIIEKNITGCTINLVSGGNFELSFSGVSQNANCSSQGTNLQSADMELIVDGQNVSATVQLDGFFSVVSNVSLKSNITVKYDVAENIYLQLPIEIELLESFQNFSQKRRVKI